jgi:hypothetical protein
MTQFDLIWAYSSQIAADVAKGSKIPHQNNNSAADWSQEIIN